MSNLNSEIIRDILIKILNDHFHCAESLEKFMLCGKEPLKVTSKYFRNAVLAEIFDDGYEIYVKTGGVRRVHGLEHSFKGFDFITEAITEISYKVYKNETKKLSKKYFKKGLEKATINHWKNNERDGGYYKYFIKFCDTIKMLRINGMGDEINLDMVPPSCRELILSNTKFPFKNISKKYFFHKFFSTSFFPAIEKLEISGMFEKFTSKNFNNFMDFICETFPNLKFLNVLFHLSYLPEWLDSYVKIMNDSKKLKFPKKLCQRKIQGKIKFSTITFGDRFEQISQNFIPQPNLNIYHEIRIISKTIEISENLIFRCIIGFGFDSLHYMKEELNYCSNVSTRKLISDSLIEGEIEPSDDILVF